MLCAVFVLAALVAASSFAAPVSSRAICTDRASLVELLRKSHSEARIGLGLTTNGKGVVEVFVAPGGTWSLLVTAIGGQSCVIATGTDWSTETLPVGDRL